MLAVRIKKFWTENYKNNSPFNIVIIIIVLENCEYINVLYLNDDVLKITKEMIKICGYVAASHTILYYCNKYIK